jgi:uncharacterized protein YecE (DUF72 family)
VHVGCSGWNYRDWRGRLYPEGLPASRWLERYAERFSTVEVNSTFYRLASRDAVARWVEQTPGDFVFACKASRYLTHMKRLSDMDRGVSRFYERIEPLVDAGKLGPVVWQLPDNFKRDDERVRHELTTDWTLVRLHYGARGRRGNYSTTEIDTWARRIAQWRRRAEVFVYFNNDWEGFAVQNALALRERLAA